MDFKLQLNRQLRFLNASCEAFDAGHLDEAIRIATCLRVLFHQTEASTSLLTHIEATNIKLLSTTVDPEPGTVFFIGMGILQLNGNAMEYVPALDDGPPINRLLPFEKWWNQTIMILDGHKIGRSDLVRDAANKDGGAHVAEKLTTRYIALSSSGSIGSFTSTYAGVENEQAIESAHLISLRQLGFEVLHSPELLKLVE